MCRTEFDAIMEIERNPFTLNCRLIRYLTRGSEKLRDKNSELNVFRTTESIKYDTLVYEYGS